MTSRFTALPLTNGESFILETDQGGKRWVILVDGGQSKREEPNENELYLAIRKHCPQITDTIDIAICTHRDHDHAGGFPAFINAWLFGGNRIGEFWLPGGWSSAVESALTDPDRLVEDLYKGTKVAANRIRDVHRAASFLEGEGSRRLALQADFRSIQASLDRLRAEGMQRSTSDINVRRRLDSDRHSDISRMGRAATSWGFTEESWQSIRSDLETNPILQESLPDRASAYREIVDEVFVEETFVDEPDIDPYIVRRTIYRQEASDLRLARSLFRNSLETAEAIKKIATSAAMFDIPVRWFDFERFESGSSPSGGNQGFLVPINSVEVMEVERETDALRLFLRLALTEQNVASLVFQRIETEAEPSVLLLADSRLAFGIDRPERDFNNHLVQPTRPIVYTAAHHGSRNNDHAYGVLASWLSTIFDQSIAVRNGGVWNQTLSRYLTISNRRCAQCYQCHGGGWSQLVQIDANGQNWVWPSGHGASCGVPKRKA